jgi:indolepyruvate ferredoxin oxidoreductase
VKGFCPSCIDGEASELKSAKKGKTERRTVHDGGDSRAGAARLTMAWGIVVAGSGTGVITIGQLLGMAAHIEGKGYRHAKDSCGLAQKARQHPGGHIQIAKTAMEGDPHHQESAWGGGAEADLVFACDPSLRANH